MADLGAFDESLLYIQNIDNISSQDKFIPDGAMPGPLQNLLTALSDEATAHGKSLDAYFATFLIKEPNTLTNAGAPSRPLPRNWDDFILHFRRDFLEIVRGPNDPPYVNKTLSDPVYAAAVTAFTRVSGATAQDFLDLIANESNIKPFEDQFQYAFEDFVKQYLYKPDGTVGTAQEFFNNFSKFFGYITTVKADSTGNALQAVGATTAASITSYEDLYDKFPPPPRASYLPNGGITTAVPTFEEVFVEFYKGFIAEHGYFASGPAYAEWAQKVFKEYNFGHQHANIANPTGAPVVTRPSRSFDTDGDGIADYTVIHTSVTTDSSARTIVLNRLFRLIASFIGVLQQVTAAQANYLSFLTQWQKAYTDLIDNIQSFSAKDGTVFGEVSITATDTLLSGLRGDANARNLNIREKLSNLRSVIGDTAKREQSRLNQSQDATTQQGSFSTSILQQMQTILQAILRN